MLNLIKLEATNNSFGKIKYEITYKGSQFELTCGRIKRPKSNPWGLFMRQK